MILSQKQKKMKRFKQLNINANFNNDTVSSNAAFSYVEGFKDIINFRSLIKETIRREGILPDQIKDFFAEIVNLPMLDIRGIGTNVGCYAGVLPTISNTEILVELAEELRIFVAND